MTGIIHMCYRPSLSRLFRTSLAASLLLLAHAQTLSAAEPSKKPPWRLELNAGAVMQFETSLDNGGDFDIDRYFLGFGATRNLGQRWNAGLDLSYGEIRYRFSGDAGFGRLDPWGTIREASIALPLRYRHNATWTFYGIPSLRYRAERGASLSDSDSWGLLVGASYRFSDRLTIGPGVGVFSDIENSADLSPILLIDWEITPNLSLTTGRGIAASRGPGLSLTWTPLERWSFRVSGRREKTGFRLDKNGPVPNGLGRDKSLPLAVSASYAPSEAVELNLFAGVDFAGNLRLEDSDGNRVADSDYEPAPFAGLWITLRP